MLTILAVVGLLAAGEGRQLAREAALEEETTGWLKLKRGTRVRLMVEEGGPMREVVGRLLSSDATTVTVDASGGPQRLSRDRMFHLSYRTGGNRKKGPAIAVAGLVGMLGCLAAVEADRPRSRGNGQGLGVICMSGLGAIGYGIVSTHADWHEWRDVRPDGLTVTTSGAKGPSRGATLALRWRPGHRGSR
jgi:hypothetical protein